MLWLILAGYGAASAVAFFIYLCWFRHVRDTTRPRWVKFLYYFLVAVTFVILGRLTGISVTLGVLPMLALLLVIPKDGYRVAVILSALYGLVIFCYHYYEYQRQELGAMPARIEKPEHPLFPFEAEGYFTYENRMVTPFVYETSNITLDGTHVVIPVPAGFKVRYGVESANDELLYGIALTNPNGDAYAFSIQNVRNSSTPIIPKERKRSFYLKIYGDEFIPSIKKEWENPGRNISVTELPRIVQNTVNAFFAFLPLIIAYEDSPQTAMGGYIFGTLTIKDKSMTIVGVSRMTPTKLDEYALMMWINEFLTMNDDHFTVSQ